MVSTHSSRSLSKPTAHARWLGRRRGIALLLALAALLHFGMPSSRQVLAYGVNLVLRVSLSTTVLSWLHTGVPASRGPALTAASAAPTMLAASSSEIIEWGDEHSATSLPVLP